MPRRYQPTTIPTLASALERYRVEELKALARLVATDRLPTRKAEVAHLIQGALTGPGLKAVYRSLNQLQQAAVAEAVHNTHGEYEPGAFRSKYGKEPDWGKSDNWRLNRPSKLRIFFHPLGYSEPLRMPDDVRKRLLAVDELWRYMRAAGYDFEVSRDLWDLYIFEKEYGSLGYSGYGKWEYLQGRYVLAVLFEYAATLGIVDVAYVPPGEGRQDYFELWGSDGLEFLSRYDGLAWFRLTGLGAYCLRVTDEYQPTRLAPRRALTVMPNLEVAVLEGANVPPGDRLVLDRFAESASERVWRLDQDRILAAVEDGHAASSLRELLEARSDGALPPPVEKFLDDVEERAGKLRDVDAARLIDCGDNELAARIAAEPSTRRYTACWRAIVMSSCASER